MITQLSGGILFAGVQHQGEMPSSLERPVLLVYSGKFKSMDGDVEIKDDDINKLASNHNSLVSKLSRLAGGKDIPAKYSPPLQLDHSQSALHTVGRLVGPVEAKEYEDPDDGKKKLGLYGKVKFLGKENVEKALDGRYTHVSIGADLTHHKISELTITPFPAAANASLLSKGKGEDDMDYASMKEKMAKYTKAKKHLMEKMKMAEEEAEEKLAKCKDEEVDHMASEQDEDDKKMAAKCKEDDDKKKAEMTANKEKLVKLQKQLVIDQENVRLAERKATITMRLSRLKAQAKITPAEIKKLKLDDVAKMSAESLDGFFKGYENRENVIPSGQMGTFRARSQADIAKDLVKLQKDALLNETLSNMPMLSKMKENLRGETKLASAAEEHMAGGMPQEGGGDGDMEMEASYSAMKQLMDEGRHDEAKEHFKKMYMAKKMASPAEEHMASEAEAQMSGLENEIKKLHNTLKEYESLIAPIVSLNN